jgi:DNA-binding winged helix-turn-helix (wHTH) protein
VERRSDTISKRANLAVRAIGHNLLLQAGDSTSVVPAVIEKSRGVFQLEFRNEFGLEPDTLIAVVQRILVSKELSKYMVTVEQCGWDHLVYGFEVNTPGAVKISCRGRSLPYDCYNIEIAFADFPGVTEGNPRASLMVGGILSLLGIVLIGTNFRTKKSVMLADENQSVHNGSDSILTIGRFAFDTTKQTLKFNEETISLTDKESRILTLLSENMGSLTRREELIQGVWTDDGVITGRSLDMFISRLRKKLSSDPDLRITNVHGKGYRLETLTDHDSD